MRGTPVSQDLWSLTSLPRNRSHPFCFWDPPEAIAAEALLGLTSRTCRGDGPALTSSPGAAFPLPVSHLLGDVIEALHITAPEARRLCSSHKLGSAQQNASTGNVATFKLSAAALPSADLIAGEPTGSSMGNVPPNTSGGFLAFRRCRQPWSPRRCDGERSGSSMLTDFTTFLSSSSCSSAVSLQGAGTAWSAEDDPNPKTRPKARLQKRPGLARPLLSGDPSSVLLSVPKDVVGSRLLQCTLRRRRIPFEGLGSAGVLTNVGAAFSGEEPASVVVDDSEKRPRRLRRVARLRRRGDVASRGAWRSSNPILLSAEEGAAVVSSVVVVGGSCLPRETSLPSTASVEEADDARFNCAPAYSGFWERGYRIVKITNCTSQTKTFKLEAEKMC